MMLAGRCWESPDDDDAAPLNGAAAALAAGALLATPVGVFFGAMITIYYYLVEGTLKHNHRSQNSTSSKNPVAISHVVLNDNRC